MRRPGASRRPDPAQAPFEPGSVVVITGIMGAGKSTVAQALAGTTGTSALRRRQLRQRILSRPMTHPRSVGQHFDEWAPHYDAQIREMVPRYEEIHATLLSLLGLRPPARVLDLGAGTGYTIRRVLQEFPTVRVTGLDVSQEMLGRARARLVDLPADRYELRVSDIAEPQIDGRYDAILSILAVHHLWPDEKRHLFSRIWEHIEPGGVFIIADYFRPAFDRLSELYALPLESDDHEAQHDHPDTTAEHLAWLLAVGFAAVDVVWKYDDVGVLVAWRTDR